MEDGLRTALMLLAVGMITVFTILALIVTFGNVLISIVNQFFPESKAESLTSDASGRAIEPSKMAAIVAAVDIVTQGKGKVTSIEKV